MKPAIIVKRALMADPYHLVPDQARLESLITNSSTAAPLPALLVPLELGSSSSQYQSLLHRPRSERGLLGVIAPPDTEVSQLAPLLAELDLVAIHFARFTDGRGHSLARTLRQELGFAGELRAQGDVFFDTLYYLEHCGFDAFDLRLGENVEEALLGLRVFSESYQSSATQPLPLFRRRLQESSLTSSTLAQDKH